MAAGETTQTKTKQPVVLFSQSEGFAYLKVGKNF